MNKKLAAASGGIAVVAAAIAVTAGTYSYFTDTESVGPQQVSTGTLNLEVGGSAASTPFNVTNVGPGWNETKTITIDNTGTMDGQLRASATKSGDAELLNAATIEISGAGVNTGPVPLNALNIPGVMLPNLPSAGGAESYSVKVSIPAEAGNNIQNKSAEFSFKLDLLQSTAPVGTTAEPLD